MPHCEKRTYVPAPISDQDGGASAPSRVRIRRAMSQGKWVDFLDMQHKKRAAVDLGETVHLVINTKLGGLVHRLQKSSQPLRLASGECCGQCPLYEGYALGHVQARAPM